MSVSARRVIVYVVCAAVFIAGITVVLPPRPAYAAQLTLRSLTLEPGTTDGASKPGGVVHHLFSFTTATTANVASIQFLYCTTASGTCTMPTGLVTTAATMGTQSGATGFTLVNTTNGSPYITRTAGTSLPSGTAVSYQLLSVTNPTTTNSTFYVRITTFTSTTATTGSTDTGVVAASTATQIVLSGTMPESLIFCTGAQVLVNGGGIPDCSTATSGVISFNQLFSPADTATATSQMAASTNASTGYTITYAGTTLTSGSNTINAITTATGSLGTRGLSQFGLNARANTTLTSTPAIGADVAPAANGTNFKGEPAAGTGYDTVDKFKFVSGQSVADSANGGAGPTDAQIFTVSYMVNVSGGQPVGTYTTTLTYVCTPQF